jgi:hypothetical protein
VTASGRRVPVPRRALAGVVLLAVALLTGAPPAGAARAAATACEYLQQSMAAQPAGAVLLASYPGAGPGPLEHTAFTYDNAVTAIALVGCGQAALARRIGDALLLALDHDRYWHDGRLRNAYAAGAPGAAPLRLAGWWDVKSRRWLEDTYQAGSDSGNMAWAMLALLTLDDGSADRRYRQGALRLAQWLQGMRDERGAGGFRGGSAGEEPSTQPLQWKSTEHNTDLAAAFGWLAKVTADDHWRQQAAHAAHFVAAMWSTGCGCFAVGTTADGESVNPLLALDAQIWPLLALPDANRQYAAALQAAARRLRFQDGYTYSEAGSGLWVEGTAQVALLLELREARSAARGLRALLDAQRSAAGGYYASGPENTATGFMLSTDPAKPRLYLHLEHLGAAAWAALAQQAFNPFNASRRLPP